MKKAMMTVATIILSAQSLWALPTTAQKLECVRPGLERALQQKGLMLIEESLDIKKSISPKSLMYIGIDSAAVLGGDASGRSADVEYIAFEAVNTNTAKMNSGYIYITSFKGLRKDADCKVLKAHGFKEDSTIALGEIHID